MIPLISESFLLRSELARRLYHEHAAVLPIIDYHSHVSPADLAIDRAFANVTELWIEPDPYKHRAMRSLGVPERFITGDAAPQEKFGRWAASVPLTAGNPLFQWTALELHNEFGVQEMLSTESAARVWELGSARLSQPSHSARQFLARARVEVLCSSDVFLEDLHYHGVMADSGFATRVVPSLRADDAFQVDAPGFAGWLQKLSLACGVPVDGLDAFEHALAQRLDAFAAKGCTVADHGIGVFAHRSVSPGEAAALFKARLAGQELSLEDSVRLRSHLLLFLGREYARRGWVMLLHLGAQRHTSSRLRRIAGPAGGYATMGTATHIPELCQFLDELDRESLLPRTILFHANPADNAALATLTGSFAEEGVPGKVQFGPAWWFNDHELGIRRHLDALSRYGLLSNFVGMTTDSRSLLSMSRHEYFRRILCDWLAGQVEQGTFPADGPLLADLVCCVCYENARRWFVNPASTHP